jgi:hypothetical protein
VTSRSGNKRSSWAKRLYQSSLVVHQKSSTSRTS